VESFSSKIAKFDAELGAIHSPNVVPTAAKKDINTQAKNVPRRRTGKTLMQPATRWNCPSWGGGVDGGGGGGGSGGFDDM